MEHTTPIYVAGMGAVGAPGAGVETCYNAIVNASDLLTPLTRFDARLKQLLPCAQVECDLELLAGREGLYKTLALALVATDEAMAHLPQTGDLRIGVVAATTVGGISRTETAYEKFRNDKSYLPTMAVEVAVHEPVVLAAEICNRIGGVGFHTISTSCSTGLHALGMAKRLIEQNYYDACIAVGTDALCITTVKGFSSLMLLDPSGCRPFDKRRAGITLGEGAGAILLVSAKAVPYCVTPPKTRITGWGASSDGYHMTAPNPEGKGAATAVLSALTEAKIDPDTIDLIVTHGTGTPNNDRSEIAGMRNVFKQLPPFCSMKRTLGHTLAASGILESVCALHAMVDNRIPPTAGFEVTDDQIGASPAQPAAKPLNTIIKNAFGFGGNNAAVIFTKAESA